MGEDRWEVYDFKREKFCFATEVPWVRITVFGDKDLLFSPKHASLQNLQVPEKRELRVKREKPFHKNYLTVLCIELKVQKVMLFIIKISLLGNIKSLFTL